MVPQRLAEMYLNFTPPLPDEGEGEGPVGLPQYLNDALSVIDEAEDIITGARAGTYGAPENVLSTVADLWSAFTGNQFDPADVAMMLALLKVARLTHDPFNKDHFIDIVGYAALAASAQGVV